MNSLHRTSDNKIFFLVNPWIEGDKDFGIGEYFELSDASNKTNSSKIRFVIKDVYKGLKNN